MNALKNGVRRPLRVLVVDDHHESARILAHLLQMQGHSCQTARDGHEALQVAEAFQPEVVFLDLGMPGMDGYQVAQLLRQRETSRIFLVALSGFGQDDDFRRSKEVGFDHHLVKPIDFGAIESLLSRHHVPSEAGD